MNGDEALSGDPLAAAVPPPPAPPGNPSVDILRGATTAPSDQSQIESRPFSRLLTPPDDPSGGLSRHSDDAAAPRDPPAGRASPSPDEFDEELVRRLRNEEALRVVAASRLADSADPARAARAIDLARRTGLPTSLVERNLDQGQARVDAEDRRRITLQTLPLRDFIADDPINARLVRDDVASIGQINKAWGWIGALAAERPYEALGLAIVSPGLAAQILPSALPVAWRDTNDAFLRGLGELDANYQLLLAGQIADQFLLIREIEKKAAEGEYLSPYERDIVARASTEKARLVSELNRLVQASVEARAKAHALSLPPALREMREAGTQWEAIKAFLKDPVRIGYTKLVESAAQLIPAAIAGGTVGPNGAAAALGLTSFTNTFLTSIVDNMQRRGVDIRDPKAVSGAFLNPDLMKEVYERSVITAAIVGFGAMAGMRLLPVNLAPATGQGLNVPMQGAVQTGLAAGAAELGPRAAGNEPHPGSVVEAWIDGMSMAAGASVANRSGGSPRIAARDAPSPKVTRPTVPEDSPSGTSRPPPAIASGEPAAPPARADADGPMVVPRVPPSEAPPTDAAPLRAPAAVDPPRPQVARDSGDGATVVPQASAADTPPVAAPPTPAAQVGDQPPPASSTRAKNETASSARHESTGDGPTAARSTAAEPPGARPSSPTRESARDDPSAPRSPAPEPSTADAAPAAQQARRTADEPSPRGATTERPSKARADVDAQLLETTRTAARLQEFNRTAERIKTLGMRELSPERTDGLVGRIVAEGEPRTVYVPVDKLQAALGRLPPEEAVDIGRALASTTQTADGDVAIPTRSYLTQLHPVAGQYLAEHIRLAPGGLSLQRARETAATLSSTAREAGKRRPLKEDVNAPSLAYDGSTIRDASPVTVGSLATDSSKSNSSSASSGRESPGISRSDAGGGPEAIPAAARMPGESSRRLAGDGRASFGTASSSRYRTTFYSANPTLRGRVVVHHAVEQQVLTRYPSVVSVEQLHSLENLRGIPRGLDRSLHKSTIRREWNLFYRRNRTVTQELLLDKATEIDAIYGYQFNPPVGSP